MLRQKRRALYLALAGREGIPFPPGSVEHSGTTDPAWNPPTISRPSPNHGGPRFLTRGCVIHSTRGGADTVEQEYEGTLNWFQNPASQVSSHDVVAANGELCFVVDDALVAWHVGYQNPEWLGIELVQPKQGDVITPAQFKTLWWRLDYLRQKYGFPLDRAHLPQHSQTAQGISAGKSDAIPRHDAAALDAFYVALFQAGG